MNRKTKMVTRCVIVLGLILAVTDGCARIDAQREQFSTGAGFAADIEAQWSEPVNLWNLNTEREDKRAYISPDGNTLVLGGTGHPGREGYVWVSRWTEDGWSDPIQEARKWPAKGVVVVQTLDGKTIFFTRNDLPDGCGEADLCYATRKGDRWSEPKSFGPEVNSPVMDALPTVTADGNTVYFWCVNREGNFGAEDIWRTVRIEGVWQKAEHLGQQINTIGDEYCPWVSEEGRVLYFGRSRFTGGRGGGYKGSNPNQGQTIDHHIWVCRIDENGIPDEPVRLGPKFNVPGYKSCCVTMSADGKKLVYASDRPGGKGSWDFWMVTKN